MRPRIVLLDLDLGRFGDGVRLITPMVRAGTNVVVVTASTDRARWGEAMRNGARKVLSKSQPLNEILATVRRINQGFPVIDVEEREALIAQWHAQTKERSALAGPALAAHPARGGRARRADARPHGARHRCPSASSRRPPCAPR